MTPNHKIIHSFIATSVLVLSFSATALAQEAAPAVPAPTAAPAEVAPVEAAPTSAPVAEAAAPVAAEGELPPPVATAVEAPVEEVSAPAEKTMNIGLWGRVDLILNDGADKLDDVSSNGVFELHIGGSVYDHIGYTANLIATYGGGPGTIMGNAALLDGIIQFDLDDAFNVWAGRMLVPSDRANFSGAWFSAPWFYPGTVANVGGPPLYGPRQGPFGRNDGVTVWGQAGGGVFKYYVGAYDLFDVGANPLISARLNLSLLNPEPGFYHSSTYYGKDVLAIGVNLQSQKDGSAAPAGAGPAAAPDDYLGLSADVLFEKDLKESGVLDLEAGFYKFEGDNEANDSAWYGLASYLLPEKMGPGKLQPLVRVQQIMPTADAADNTTIFEGQLGYVIDAYSARLALGFQHAGHIGGGDAEVNALYLGAQIEK